MDTDIALRRGERKRKNLTECFLTVFNDIRLSKINVSKHVSTARGGNNTQQKSMKKTEFNRRIKQCRRKF